MCVQHECINTYIDLQTCTHSYMYIYAPSHPAPLSQHKTPQLIWYAARWTRVSRHDRRTPNLGLRVRVTYMHV